MGEGLAVVPFTPQNAGLKVDRAASRCRVTTPCSVQPGRGALGEGRGSLEPELQIPSQLGQLCFIYSYSDLFPYTL